MHVHRTLASTLALTALLSAGCADTALVEPASMDLALSTSAAESPYGVVTALRLSVGDSYQLTARKLANDTDAPLTSIRWSIDGNDVATITSEGLVTAIGHGEAIATAARGVHREQVTIIVGECEVTPLATGASAGVIADTDCRYAFNRQRIADYFSVETAPSEVIEFVATGVLGTLGYKEATANPLAGTLHGAVGANVRMRVISNGGTLQPFFAAAKDSLGSYTISRTTPAEPHQCGSAHVFRPGVTFTATLTPANSCLPTVEFPMIPQALGKQLNAHYFNMIAEGGKSYTVTITGVSDTFNPALTVFAGGSPIGQSGPGAGAAPSSRTVTFTRPTTGYVLVEVATGRFINGLEPENWVIESGTYTMTMSH